MYAASFIIGLFVVLTVAWLKAAPVLHALAAIN